MKQDTLFARLRMVLNLQPEDDLTQLLARGMPVIEKVDPNMKSAFQMYYGLNGCPPMTHTAIGQVLNKQRSIVTLLHKSANRLLGEVLDTTWQERINPQNYNYWPLRAFFTHERGQQAGLSTLIVSRVRTIVSEESRYYPTVNDLCEQSERSIMRIPNCGVRGVEAIQAILATARLTLSAR